MNEFTACPDLEELAAWIDGQVDEPSRGRLAAHVGGCDRCAETVENVLAFSEELELAEDGAASSAHESFEDEAPESTLGVRETIRANPAPRTRWPLYLAAAVVACGIVLCWRWATLEPAGFGRERQAALDAALAGRQDERVRGAVEDPALVTDCKHFFGDPSASESNPKLLAGCLGVASQNGDLAYYVANRPRFQEWLVRPDLRPSCCRVLFGATGLSAAFDADLAACKALTAHSPQPGRPN